MPFGIRLANNIFQQFPLKSNVFTQNINAERISRIVARVANLYTRQGMRALYKLLIERKFVHTV